MSKIKVKVCDVADINANNFDFNDKKFVYYLDTGSITSNVVDSYQMLNTNEKIPSRARRAVKENTIVYSSVRPKLCHFGILRNLPENVVVSTGFITLDAKPNIDPDYLYNCITTKDKISYISKIADTSVSSYPSITPSDLANMEIEIEEDIMKQRNISKLLTNIDNKIANNNNIILNLESMAKTIYDYWFLQFNFPNEDGKPYKSSGGKMVWNEELKREIPEGWSEISLDKIADMKTVSITPIQTEMYNHYSIPAYDNFKTPTVENGKDINSNKYLVYENCILVSKLNPHFKRIWNVYSINEKSICSTEFMPFVSIDGGKEFLYSTLNSDEFYTFTVNNSNSSTGSRKRMQPEAYKDFKLAYPLNDNKVISKFCDVTRGVLKQQDSLIKENQELISLRDFLLPMLMNGQVTFKEEA